MSNSTLTQLAHQTYPTTYHTQTVGSTKVFYRAAGDEDNPVILLLHGFPSSSHQFRNLIPQLAPYFRVIAPDLPGFGSTATPKRGDFVFSFDNLAEIIEAFTEAIGLKEFAIYVFDYGAPVGFRLATRHPERITAIISQNGNAYEAGLEPTWAPIQRHWEVGSYDTRDALRGLLTRQTTEFQYFTGTPEHLKSRISPDAIHHDQGILDRDADIQLDLFYDYRNNVKLYPQWQAYLRTHRPPLLAIWGKNDPFFGPAGAEAFKQDVPDAEVELLDAGHFALESHGELIAERIIEFLKRKLS